MGWGGSGGGVGGPRVVLVGKRSMIYGCGWIAILFSNGLGSVRVQTHSFFLISFFKVQ